MFNLVIRKNRLFFCFMGMGGLKVTHPIFWLLGYLVFWFRMFFGFCWRGEEDFFC